MIIRTEFSNQAEEEVCRMLKGEARYKEVEAATNVPWYVVALIHEMEADCDFTKHLHNGDPLTQRTVHVPKGRPTTGKPPFPWVVSAIDAVKGYQWTDWSVPGVLYLLESFNGFGYTYRGINSPYLWSKTNHYTRGLYVADGKYDPNAQSSQIGGAILFKYMICYATFGRKPKKC